jgi:hypothetical protein
MWAKTTLCFAWSLEIADPISFVNRNQILSLVPIMVSTSEILRISWVYRVTNDEVLRSLHREREVLQIVKRRKLEYFGHFLRGPKHELLKTIIQGHIEGKRRIGRKYLSWLRNLRAWIGLSVEQLFRIAFDRDKYKNLISVMTCVQAYAWTLVRHRKKKMVSTSFLLPPPKIFSYKQLNRSTLLNLHSK